MAKKRKTDKEKLAEAKKNRDISAAVALGGGILTGIAKSGVEGMDSMTEQYREALARINGWENRARKGGKFTEQEAKFIQGGEDSFEKLRGAISQSPRTKKAKLKGAIVGAAMGALPGGLGVLTSNMEIKRLEKRIAAKEAKEKSYSVMDKMFSKNFVEPSDDEVSKLSRNQILSLLDKKNKQVDKDKEEYINKKTTRGGIIGALVGAGLGSLASGLGNKYIGKMDTKTAILNSLIGGGLGAYAGYGQGRKIAKNSAKDYVKDADEFNNNKVTTKYAKKLDALMRKYGHQDDLEAVNAERIRNEKKAKSELKDYLKHNSVLNLGRNSIRVR